MMLLLGLLVAGAIAIPALRPQQPHYEGRPLTDWLDDLTVERIPQPKPLTQETLASRRQNAETALREMGTNTLPFLVNFLSLRQEPGLVRRKLQALLEKQSIIRIRFPAIPDRQGQAVEAFRVLGAAAKPAIPRLGELLESGANYWSVECLKAIGPQSIPALAHAMSSTNQGVVREAIEILGAFGTASGAVVPRVAEFAAGTNESLAYGALQVLSEIAPDPSSFVPLFEARLSDTNLIPAAAFALGRIGPAGVPPLLRALVRENRLSLIAAVAALAPEVRNARRDRYPAGYSFQGVVCLFNSHTLSAACGLFENRDVSSIVVPAITGVLDHPDAAVRLQILEVAARYGAGGVSALSHGLSDTSPEVRQKAADLINGLGFQVKAGAIVRGPRWEKHVCLVFTGHACVEGGATILDALEAHKAKASFFLAGDLLTNTACLPLVHRMIADGHYVGPHSERPTLYCTRDGTRQTAVRRGDFLADLRNNLNQVARLGVVKPDLWFFLPPRALHNQKIADWAKVLGFTMVNPTPGTSSTADGPGEGKKDCASSKAILGRIVAKDREDPTGLNGCFLLLDLGSASSPSDKSQARIGELLDYLTGKGYELVRVDQLLGM